MKFVDDHYYAYAYVWDEPDHLKFTHFFSIENIESTIKKATSKFTTRIS